MYKKRERRIAIGGFVLSVFLFLCAAINVFSGHTAAAISSFGSGIFFFSISLAAYKKSKGNKQ